MATFRTKCSVFRHTKETFVERVIVAGQPARFEFTKDILWVLQSESQQLFVHGRRVLKEGATCNDYYGYLTSTKQDSPSYESICTHWGVSRESSLEIQRMTTVFLSPAIETDANREENLRYPDHLPMYSYIPDGWRQESMEDGDMWFRRLERVAIAEEVTWSSKLTPAENAAKLTWFQEHFTLERVAEHGVSTERVCG
jgi:hypothetical protein